MQIAIKKYSLVLVIIAGFPLLPAVTAADTLWIMKPDRVFDGQAMQEGWLVAVHKDTIVFAGNPSGLDAGTRAYPAGVRVPVELKGRTLMPGMIEGHAHLFLHAYNETSWNDQVLQESRAERTARAVNHARETLLAGFTTVRDLGTEGAGYDDVGLKQAIEKGIIPGPRLLVAGRAIVATGSYGPKSESPDIDFPMGAAEADGLEGLTREIRTQIGKGADVIKLYADYRWGPGKTARPTFTLDELKLAVAVAGSSGRPVVAHASTNEAMRRAAEAGVATIEHGDDGDAETFSLMKKMGVVYFPTLAASESVTRYRGWKKGEDKTPGQILRKHASFAAALASGVIIGMGGDVGVYPHGTNALEMELMVEYGMPALQVLRAATSVNAAAFGLPKQGRIRPGMLADLVAVMGNPAQAIGQVRQVAMVMKGGNWVKQP